MSVRRVLSVLGVLALAMLLTTPAVAQEKGQAQQQRKLSGDERREYVALSELVDAIMAGKQQAPADLKLTFHNHFLKSNTNVYVPYILEISGGKFSSFPLAMYVRATRKAEAGVAPASAAKSGDKPAEKPADWPFADVYFLTENQLAANGDALELGRALELPPGEYTLYVAMRERAPKDKKQGPAKAVVLAQPLSVPDFNKSLTTSSMIMAKSLDAAPEQLTGQQQLEQPFTISGYRVVPAFSSTIPQSGELLFVFFIYNEGVAAGSGKPDVDVEYNFFRAAEEKAFTRLATQSFNATTLPGEFNLAIGHQVFVGQGIPLKSPQMTFAPGEYRLEIKITDKTNSQSITRNLTFAVS